MKDSIIIVSGGMDSITLLYDWKDRIALGISFDYGSNHNAKEIPLAKMHCERLGIRHITIPLDFMHQYFKSSLLEGGDPFLVLADYRSYVECHERVDKAFRDKDAWAKSAILNTARVGKFSSDRTIAEYAKDIWRLAPLKVEQNDVEWSISTAK